MGFVVLVALVDGVSVVDSAFSSFRCLMRRIVFSESEGDGGEREVARSVFSKSEQHRLASSKQHFDNSALIKE